MRRDDVGRGPLYVATPKATLAISGVTISVLMLAPAVSSPERWLGSLNETMSTFALASVLASVAVASVGAWLGGQQRRWGVVEWAHTSGRSAAELQSSSLRATLFVSIGSYLLVLTSMTLLTLWRGAAPGPGGLHLLLEPAIIAASGVAHAGLGVLLGRMFPRNVAMPVAAATPYAAYFFSAFYSGIPGIHLLSAGETRAWSYMVPNVATVVIEAAFWAAVASMVVLACLGQLTWSKRCGLVVSAVLAVGILAGETYVDVPDATTPVCRTGEITVCTDQAHRSVLPSYAEQVVGAASALPMALRPRRVVSDETLRTNASDLVAPPIRGNTTPALVIDQDMFRITFGDEVLGRCLYHGADTSSHAQDVTSFLLIWWRLRAGADPSVPAYPGSPSYGPGGMPSSMRAKAESFAKLSPSAQATWLEKHAFDLRVCNLKGVDPP